ncbi:hypothetical protein FHS95_002075 [Sphingomonas naasensis]|uniref:Uncharacterized protein n=1 Tax=Sphingomonas naasensis TaxID=1344951 RepID=A0A4S1WMJ9_9SPHN|nr:hypothetical protein [Sphingomonas naasensis]NIJ20383.1 hypothetical protein [Sphingomonas naasensis]TGX44491.1 hypothetical protein E5A74_06855 [Sphingomonas naasensis]
MRSALFAKLGLGFVGICACGTMAGIGLANYTESGSFQFYRQARMAAWEPTLPPQSTALESTDLAFASDHRATRADGAPEAEVASLYP